MHYFIIKISNNWDLQQIALHHLSNIDFQDFTNLCEKCAAIAYSFLVVDSTLASNNPLRFRKNILERI